MNQIWLNLIMLQPSNGDEAFEVAQEQAGKDIHLLMTDIVSPG